MSLVDKTHIFQYEASLEASPSRWIIFAQLYPSWR